MSFKVTDAQLQKIFNRLRQPAVGINLKIRRYKDKEIENAFDGKQLSLWLESDLTLTKQEAKALAQRLLDKEFILSINNSSAFKDDTDALFTLQSVEESESQSVLGAQTDTNKTTRRSELWSLSPAEIVKQLSAQLFGGQASTAEDVRTCARVVRSNRVARAGRSAAAKGGEEVLAVTVKGGDRLAVHRVRVVHGTYSITKTWQSEELKMIDVDDDNDTRFTIAFDKPHYFQTFTATERHMFMWTLLQLYQQFKGFLPQTHIDILELRLLVEESNPSVASSTESVSYHKELMTEEEEKLIDDMLRKRMTNYSDINVVTEQLSKELVVLETENIHDLIAITERVKQMNGLLKNSSKQLSNVDAHLEEYQDQLDTISVYIEQIEKKNNTMDLITRNQKALLQEIDDVMAKVQLDEATTQTLRSGDFAVGKGLDSAVRAASKLDQVMKAQHKPGITEMLAIIQQMEQFKKLSTAFSVRFSKYITEQFNALFSKALEGLPKRMSTESSEIIYMNKKSFMEPIQAYKTLIHRLKEFDTEECENVRKAYVQKFTELYKKELRDYFHSLKKTIMREKSSKFSFKSTSVGFKEKVTARLTGQSATTTNDSNSGDDRSDDDMSVGSFADYDSDSEVDTKSNTSDKRKMSGTLGDKKKAKMKVTQVYTSCLKNVLPLVMSEQKFSADVFNFTADESEGLQQHVAVCFDELLSHLTALINFGYKTDRFYAMSFWVDTVKYEQEYSKTSPFIMSILGKLKEQILERITKFIDVQVDYIKDTEVRVRRAGVLAHVKKFIVFMERLEENGASANEARELAEKCYLQLVDALFEWLIELATPKSKKEEVNNNNVDIATLLKGEKSKVKQMAKKIKSGAEGLTNYAMQMAKGDADRETLACLVLKFENFHHFYLNVSKRNAAVLKPYVEKATTYYKESRDTYVKYLVEKRFKTLFEFFDGVEKLSKTMPPETVQFQNAFSNQVLGKLITKYTADRLKKGLYTEYKRINHEVSSGEGLIPVVWLCFKEYFIQSYKHFEELIKLCYKNQTLSASVEDMNVKFNDVEDKYKSKKDKKSKSGKKGSSDSRRTDSRVSSMDSSMDSMADSMIEDSMREDDSFSDSD